MSIGKFSVFSIFEILDCGNNLRFALPGSGRVRGIVRGALSKEMYTDFSFPDMSYELDYARIVPRRLKLREWGGSHDKDVFV